MSTLTKAKKTARSPRKPSSRRRVETLPPAPASPLYGLEHTIGCVSIGAPSDKATRRRVMRARIYADNHS